MCTAEAAHDYPRQRQALLAKLKRTTAAILRWNEYAANRELPPAARRYVPRPDVSRETLVDLHRMLVEEIARRDAGDR